MTRHRHGRHSCPPQIHPSDFGSVHHVPLGGTWLWGYRRGDALTDDAVLLGYRGFQSCFSSWLIYRVTRPCGCSERRGGLGGRTETCRHSGQKREGWRENGSIGLGSHSNFEYDPIVEKGSRVSILTVCPYKIFLEILMVLIFSILLF